MHQVSSESERRPGPFWNCIIKYCGKVQAWYIQDCEGNLDTVTLKRKVASDFDERKYRLWPCALLIGDRVWGGSLFLPSPLAILLLYIRGLSHPENLLLPHRTAAASPGSDSGMLKKLQLSIEILLYHLCDTNVLQ